MYFNSLFPRVCYIEVTKKYLLNNKEEPVLLYSFLIFNPLKYLKIILKKKKKKTQYLKKKKKLGKTFYRCLELSVPVTVEIKNYPRNLRGSTNKKIQNRLFKDDYASTPKEQK